MKKILALTLALMLALSLTAALAANKGENELGLLVKVTPQTVNNVTAGETWIVDITGSNLTWNLIQTDTLTGTAEGWDPLEGSNGNYGSAEVNHTYKTTLAANEKPTKEIIITNNSNFDVQFDGALSMSTAFASAVSLEGAKQGILVNKANASNFASMFVALDTGALSTNNSISSGQVGSVIITLSKSGDVYPYNP